MLCKGSTSVIHYFTSLWGMMCTVPSLGPFSHPELNQMIRTDNENIKNIVLLGCYCLEWGFSLVSCFLRCMQVGLFSQWQERIPCFLSGFCERTYAQGLSMTSNVILQMQPDGSAQHPKCYLAFDRMKYSKPDDLWCKYSLAGLTFNSRKASSPACGMTDYKFVSKSLTFQEHSGCPRQNVRTRFDIGNVRP